MAQEPPAKRIEMTVRSLPQLFETLDPSPFHEKDLDPKAAKYILETAEWLGGGPLKLVVFVPECDVGGAVQLAPAVNNYFERDRLDQRQRLKSLLREGRLALLLGVLFVAGTFAVNQLATTVLGEGWPGFMSEGLTIIGWVALWRPVEILLYEWWPVLGRMRLARRLAAMPVECVALAGARTAPTAGRPATPP